MLGIQTNRSFQNNLLINHEIHYDENDGGVEFICERSMMKITQENIFCFRNDTPKTWPSYTRFWFQFSPTVEIN